MAERQIVVEVVGDASKLNRATTDAIGHAGSLTDKLRGIGKGMVIGAGIGAFNLLSDAISIGIGKLGEAHQAFLEDEASAARLGQTLRNTVPGWDGNTAGIEAYAAAQQRLAFSDDEVRDSIAQLVGVTHDLAAAQDLNNLAMDLARSKNIDLATAADIVTKAQQGNGKALKALGIDTAGATDAAALLDAIQRNVAGSAETWAALNEGKLAVSNVKVQESMEKVGAIVNEVASVAVPAIAEAFVGLVDIFGRFWDATEPIREVLGPVLEGVFDAIGFVIGGVIDTIENVMDRIAEAIRFAQELAAVLGPSQGVQDFRAQFRAQEGRDPTRQEFDQFQAGTLPGFAAGGIVPGAIGEPMVAVVHGGERIISNGAGGGPVTFNVTMNGVQDVTGFLQALKREVDRTGVSLIPT